MNILPICKLNKALNSDVKKEITAAEAFYYEQLEAASRLTASNAEKKPIILLSGPSGSSKTTTAMRLKLLLNEQGLSAHVISMDNYFLPLDHLTLEERAKIDLEAPARVDIPLLTEHLERFLACLPTQLPIFNFTKQSREKGEVLCRKEKELIIVEGIHALNPEVIGPVQSHAEGIYVSVRTRLSSSNKPNKLLHPSMIRLMRRLMRDRLFRGRKTEDIIRAFKSVQRGEQKYIMPYKKNASVNIDTFMSFEAAVYALELVPELRSVSPDFELHAMAEDILCFLEEISPISSSLVPETSIVREFIGGSLFG